MRKIGFVTISLSFLLLISLVLNVYYYNNGQKYERKVDAEFLSNLKDINAGFKFFKEDPKKVSMNIRSSSAYIGSARALSKITSFSKQNKILFSTLSELNVFFSSFPEEKIIQNLDKISEYTKKLHDNPSDTRISEELSNYLFQIENQ